MRDALQAIENGSEYLHSFAHFRVRPTRRRESTLVLQLEGEFAPASDRAGIIRQDPGTSLNCLHTIQEGSAIPPRLYGRGNLCASTMNKNTIDSILDICIAMQMVGALPEFTRVVPPIYRGAVK